MWTSHCPILPLYESGFRSCTEVHAAEGMLIEAEERVRAVHIILGRDSKCEAPGC